MSVIVTLYCWFPADAHRQSRILVYPKGGVCKLVIGVGVPVDLPKKLLSLGINFQFQYFVPTNVTILRQYPEIQTRRSLRETVNRATSYEALQSVLDRYGVEGRSCLLRTICEVAETPIDHNGLVGELLHVILTPGYGANTEERIDWEYHEARRLGERGVDCRRAYPGCPFGYGLLDLISLVDS
ncbi:uncharacterized protein [Periplaneta americana]